jgi:hypothetical protein
MNHICKNNKQTLGLAARRDEGAVFPAARSKNGRIILKVTIIVNIVSRFPLILLRFSLAWKVLLYGPKQIVRSAG